MTAHYGFELELDTIAVRDKFAPFFKLPEIVYVENMHSDTAKLVAEAYKAFKEESKKTGFHQTQLAQAGWKSEEQLKAYVQLRRREKPES